MQTAHAIVADFIKTNAIGTTEFYAWFQDGGYSENEANIHDARYTPFTPGSENPWAR